MQCLLGCMTSMPADISGKGPLDQTVKINQTQMFYPAASKLVCRYFSHQVHTAIKIISTARNCTLKRKLNF